MCGIRVTALCWTLTPTLQTGKLRRNLLKTKTYLPYMWYINNLFVCLVIKTRVWHPHTELECTCWSIVKLFCKTVADLLMHLSVGMSTKLIRLGKMFMSEICPLSPCSRAVYVQVYLHTRHIASTSLIIISHIFSATYISRLLLIIEMMRLETCHNIPKDRR